MFKEIFLFEMSCRLKQPAIYIYFAILFLLSFLVINIAGGALKSFSIALSTGKAYVNSPYSISLFLAVIANYVGIIITSSVVGIAVYKDFSYNTHSLFYTKPITKFGYLGGRFAASLLIAFIILLGIGAGFLIGSQMPWLDTSKIGPISLMTYVQPYLTLVLPNLIFTGAIFFTLATLSRNILAVYIGSIAFLVLYSISSILMTDLDNQFLAAILDPLGSAAFELLTKYWTITDKNTFLIPLKGVFFLNRLLWVGIGLVIFLISYYKFSFSHLLPSGKMVRKKLKRDREYEEIKIEKIALPEVSQQFSFAQNIRQYLKLTGLEFGGILKNIYFSAIVILGVVLLFTSASSIGKLYGTPTLPVTYMTLEVLYSTFQLFLYIIIVFYSGELVWKERDQKMNQIYDCLPTANWVPFASKLSSLLLVQTFLLGIIVICGIIIQTFKGYYNYELGLYIKELFGIKLINLILLSVLAMLIQIVVNHKYTGHFVIILCILFLNFSGMLGLEHNLLKYISAPSIIYSDMNTYGHFIFPYLSFKLYWLALAVLFIVISILFWIRGTESHFKLRFRLAKQRFNKSSRYLSILALITFVLSGSFIFYNTNVLNKYQTSKEREEEAVAYEKQYKKFENLPQPKITDVNLYVDIFPTERRLSINGTYNLKNKTASSIDSIHILLNENIKINKLNLNRSYKIVLEDKKLGYYIYKIDNPLKPSDTAILSIDLEFVNKGFKNAGSGTSVVFNGSFIHSTSVLPSIGYNSNPELSEDNTRKKYGLSPKELMASIHDTLARKRDCISLDADWINFQVTVSTDKDQIAIAPGYLQQEWTEGQRRYFHYKMDNKILNFYAFLSAKYEIKKDKWMPLSGNKDQAVNLEIYYHKGHEYNVDRMIKSIKKSLDYYTTNFSPYQYKQVRIIEFPRYAGFAQSFPNTIPYSESIGFIMDTTNEDNIDYCFYVTAHEVAHQWWAHQVIGADVQGASVMMETLSQYAALMVMEKEYGKEQMVKFLKHEMNNYLRGRASERKNEQPLMLVEGQQYVYYNKGSVVMYALKDYIGEDSLNVALKKYIQKVAYQEAPYTTSLELLSEIRKVTPDSLQYLIKDMFETITLYENKTTDISSKKRSDGKYEINLTVETKKLRADSLGKEIELPVNDWIDIGILSRKKINGVWKDEELYCRKHKITQKKMEFTIVVNEEPIKGGIDIYNKLIDRNPEDNVKNLSKLPSI